MLKAQLARALQLPMDERAEQGLHLLRSLDEAEAPTADSAERAAGASPNLRAEEHDCDRVIALLRARLSAR